MSAKLLRQKYNAKFVGLAKHSNLTGWLIVLSFVAQIALAVGLGHLALQFAPSLWAAAFALLLTIYIGTRLRALNNIVHEASHATFVEGRGQNIVIGKTCAALTMGCFLDYRDEHLSHHTHIGDYSKDLDFQGIEHLALHDPLTGKVLARHILTPLIGRHLPYYLHLNFSMRDGPFLVALKAALLSAVVMFGFLAPLSVFLFAVVPFALIYSALNYWADCMGHAGLVAGADELDKSRNVLAPPALAWLFFPRHDCFHLVHHLFPQVPARHLQATHHILSRDPTYVERPNAVRAQSL